MKKGLWMILLLPLLVMANPIKQIVIFGDSLSDTGRLYKYSAHFAPKSPPYYKGHFSNGMLWIEALYQHYFPNGSELDKFNYAVGGAGAVLSSDEILPYTISTEISEYLMRHPFQDKSQILFVIWAGGNNYLNAPLDGDYVTSKVNDAIAHQILRLAAYGGKYFFIANLPDMSKTPWAKENGTEATLKQLTQLHNSKLVTTLEALKKKHPELTTIFFDVGALFDKYYHQPEKFGLKYLDKPCIEGGWFLSRTLVRQYAKQQGLSLSNKMLEALMTNPQLSEAMRVSLSAFNSNDTTKDCHEYLFFDRIHPSHKIHEVLAKFAIDTIDAAGLTFK